MRIVPVCQTVHIGAVSGFAKREYNGLLRTAKVFPVHRVVVYRDLQHTFLVRISIPSKDGNDATTLIIQTDYSGIGVSAGTAETYVAVGSVLHYGVAITEGDAAQFGIGVSNFNAPGIGVGSPGFAGIATGSTGQYGASIAPGAIPYGVAVSVSDHSGVAVGTGDKAGAGVSGGVSYGVAVTEGDASQWGVAVAGSFIEGALGVAVGGEYIPELGGVAVGSTYGVGSDGGVAVSGEYLWVEGSVGGVGVGGTATILPDYVSSGGMVVSGSGLNGVYGVAAPALRTFNRSASGGIVTAFSDTTTGIYNYASAGGAPVSGVVATTKVTNRIATGGVVTRFGDSSTSAHEYNSKGGAVVSGAGVCNFYSAVAGSSTTKTLFALGGIVSEFSDVILTLSNYASSGGLIASGSALSGVHGESVPAVKVTARAAVGGFVANFSEIVSALYNYASAGSILSGGSALSGVYGVASALSKVTNRSTTGGVVAAFEQVVTAVYNYASEGAAVVSGSATSGIYGITAPVSKSTSRKSSGGMIISGSALNGVYGIPATSGVTINRGTEGGILLVGGAVVLAIPTRASKGGIVVGGSAVAAGVLLPLNVVWGSFGAQTYGYTLPTTSAGIKAVTGCSSNVTGTFSCAGGIPYAGTTSVAVTFTATDTRYAPVTHAVPISVAKYAITYNPTNISINYSGAVYSMMNSSPWMLDCAVTGSGGTGLHSGVLSGGYFDVATETGAYTVLFTPSDTTNYSGGGSCTVTIDKINQAAISVWLDSYSMAVGTSQPAHTSGGSGTGAFVFALGSYAGSNCMTVNSVTGVLTAHYYQPGISPNRVYVYRLGDDTYNPTSWVSSPLVQVAAPPVISFIIYEDSVSISGGNGAYSVTAHGTLTNVWVHLFSNALSMVQGSGNPVSSSTNRSWSKYGSNTVSGTQMHYQPGGYFLVVDSAGVSGKLYYDDWFPNVSLWEITAAGSAYSDGGGGGVGTPDPVPETLLGAWNGFSTNSQLYFYDSLASGYCYVYLGMDSSAGTYTYNSFNKMLTVTWVFDGAFMIDSWTITFDMYDSGALAFPSPGNNLGALTRA